LSALQSLRQAVRACVPGFNAETIHAATKVMREVIAEVLAQKVQRAELREADALRIGRQILRENALALYPTLNDKLWKHRARLTPQGLETK
jgi:hypothetical protein